MVNFSFLYLDAEADGCLEAAAEAGTSTSSMSSAIVSVSTLGVSLRALTVGGQCLL